MKYKKVKLGALLLPLALSLSAQQNTSAAGGDGSGSGGTVAYTIGQVVYTTNSGTTGSSSEGVQQPYEILTTGIKDPKFNISLIAFPNPATNSLTLQVENFNNENISYQLFDAQGKMLSVKTLTGNQTQIDLNSFAAATYFINIIQDNKKIQSFKIIKR